MEIISNDIIDILLTCLRGSLEVITVEVILAIAFIDSRSIHMIVVIVTLINISNCFCYSILHKLNILMIRKECDPMRRVFFRTSGSRRSK